MKIERSNFERYAGGTYTFTYTRYYDGVPVRDQETYVEVASKAGIFNCPFADIPENMIGYATLGAAFGIVSDKSDVLDAQTNLTRADALIIIYNYLTRE